SLICSYRNVYVWGGRFTPDKLSSTEGKVWVLEGAGSYKAGPYPGSGEWYEGPDTVERACQMDDMFIFRDSGTMWYDARGVMWGEPFMGISPARCVDEADIPAPFDAFTSGTRSFDATPSTFAGPGTITIIGPGAFLGYAKPFNAGEYDGLIAPRERIEYEVLGYARAGDTEVLILTIDISPIQDGSAWWTITLRSVP
ncbi:MAG: hypothetical protein R3301_19785, partial [Saprospiraceae bacterium]|nr:hypothetical protein [Saprospiraceae bacterium]